MNDAFLSPVLQYGFAGAFAVTLACLLTLVWYVLTKVLRAFEDNTEANIKLTEAVCKLNDRQGVMIEKYETTIKDLYQRPCLKDRA